jgi:hypothetical protein
VLTFSLFDHELCISGSKIPKAQKRNVSITPTNSSDEGLLLKTSKSTSFFCLEWLSGNLPHTVVASSTI